MKTTSLVWLTAMVLLSLTAQAQPLQPEVLVSFAGTNGSFPMAGLTLGPDGNLYGTTSAGGVPGAFGTVFRVTTNGILTTLASFKGTNGANPQAALTLGNDGSFYSAIPVIGSSDSIGHEPGLWWPQTWAAASERFKISRRDQKQDQTINDKKIRRPNRQERKQAT